jgi:hypothetical protein
VASVVSFVNLGTSSFKHSLEGKGVTLALRKACILEQESLHQQTGLKFEKETSEMLRLEHGFVWC